MENVKHQVLRRADSRIWSLCGNNVMRTQIVFISQVIIIYIIIISCLVNLSIGNRNESLFICLLSSSIGYLLPNPSYSDKKPDKKINLGMGGVAGEGDFLQFPVGGDLSGSKELSNEIEHND